jgi:hypothetical protein
MAQHAQLRIGTACRSTSAIRKALGSAAPTRTPTGCCANTSPRGPTCHGTAPRSSPRSPPHSMAGPENTQLENPRRGAGRAPGNDGLNWPHCRARAHRRPHAAIAARVAGTVARPGSHRTVRTLFVYGSSGQRVVNPAAGRFATSNHPHSASCGGSGATMCWCARRCSSTRKTSPRLAKYTLRRPWSTAAMWLSAHQDLFPA